MRKRDEMASRQSCLGKAHEYEMMFVLLSRDPAAPAAIRAWIAERLRLGLNVMMDPKLEEAEAAAKVMEEEQPRYQRIARDAKRYPPIE